MDKLALYLQPLFTDVAAIAITAASGLAVNYAKKHWNFTVNQGLVDNLDKAATNAAAVGYAKADAAIDEAVLHEQSPEVKAAVQNVLQVIPDALTKLVSPAELDQLVLSKFGRLQASASMATPKA